MQHAGVLDISHEYDNRSRSPSIHRYCDLWESLLDLFVITLLQEPYKARYPTVSKLVAPDARTLQCHDVITCVNSGATPDLATRDHHRSTDCAVLRDCHFSKAEPCSQPVLIVAGHLLLTGLKPNQPCIRKTPAEHFVSHRER